MISSSRSFPHTLLLLQFRTREWRTTRTSQTPSGGSTRYILRSPQTWPWPRIHRHPEIHCSTRETALVLKHFIASKMVPTLS